MSHPKFSIIIPAYNAAKTLRLCLQAVSRQQSEEAYEVIVVDDGSTDQTADIARAFEGVRYFFQENKGPAAARNRGAREAKGGILCFTDSDCLPRTDWLARLSGAIGDEDIAAVSGSYGLANPQSLLAQGINDEIAYRHNKFLPSYPKVFGSYNVAIRKDVFDAVGGFDENYRFASGEDNDLSYRIGQSGYKIFFVKEAVVDHFHPESVVRYLQEQRRHGFWRARLYRNHPRMLRGDDYTFWKDVIEIPLSFAGLGVPVMILVPGIPAVIAGFGLVSLCIHMLIEIVFAMIIGGPKRKGFLLAVVMLLRSYARTFGLVAGMLHIQWPWYKKIESSGNKKG